MIKVTAEAAAKIRESVVDKGNPRPIRVDIHNTGCCDCSLGLALDSAQDTDLVQDIEGLTFVVSREIDEIAGDITISYVDENGKKGFVVTSSKPLNEWEGFGVCDLKQ